MKNSSVCHNKELVILDRQGQWVAYCPECKAIFVSHDDGVKWQKLADIQPTHPRPFWK